MLNFIAIYTELIILRSNATGPAWVQVFIFLIPLAIALANRSHQAETARQVERKLFNPHRPMTKDSLFQAYVYLAVKLIYSERSGRREKFDYMKNYFLKRFPNATEDLPAFLKQVGQHPIPSKKIAIWLNHNLIYSKRTQVMYFLFGIAVVDGRVDQGELILLQEIADLMEITPKDFQSILSSYKQKHRTSSTGSTPKYNARKTAAKILGVSEYASKDEIKKAFRGLAKKYHPDAFANESQEHIDIAEERFMQIQAAYELLMK